MSDGWTVQVTMRTDGGGTSEQLFRAAIANPLEAEEAVRAYAQIVTQDVLIRAVSPISEAELFKRNLKRGQVTQWI